MSRPRASIQAETPVFAARTTGTPSSTARHIAVWRCSQRPGPTGTDQKDAVVDRIRAGDRLPGPGVQVVHTQPANEHRDAQFFLERDKRIVEQAVGGPGLGSLDEEADLLLLVHRLRVQELAGEH